MGPRKAHVVPVESSVGQGSMSLPRDKVVRGHVSACRRSVEELVGERVLPAVRL